MNLPLASNVAPQGWMRPDIPITRGLSMSRSIARIVTAFAAVMTVLVGSLAGAQLATAALPSVGGLAATPLPPGKVSVQWDTYTAFTVDHYEVRLQPGFGYQETLPGDTEVVFNDLTWGTTYTTHVEAVEAGTGATSPVASLELPGIRLQASLSKSVAVRGNNFSVNGRLRDRFDKGIANATVHLQALLYPYDSNSYQTIGTAKSGANGAFTFPTKANRNAIYRVLYSAANTTGGWYGYMMLDVKVPTSLRFSDNPVQFGTSVRFSGTLACPGALVQGTRVNLQRRVNQSWQTMKSSTVSGTSTYSIDYTPTTHADLKWRVLVQPSGSFIASPSKGKVLTVS